MVEYWKSKLNQNAAGCYDRILRAIQRCDRTIPCGNVPPETATESYYAVYKDHPELFYMNNAHTVSHYQPVVLLPFTPSVINTTIETEHIYSAQQISRCRARIRSIISGLKKQSELENVLSCLEYLVRNTRYAVDHKMNQNAAAALCFQSAQCSGIAKALQLLLDALDVFCIVVEGEATGNDGVWESHAWNIVRLDGRYYHVDPTFLLGANPSKSEPLRYLFVFYDDAMLSKTHTWDRDSVPKCSDNSLHGRLSGKTPITVPPLPFERAQQFRTLYDLKCAVEAMIDARKKRLVFTVCIPSADPEEQKQLVTTSCNMVVERKGIPFNYRLDWYDEKAVLTVSYK